MGAGWYSGVIVAPPQLAGWGVGLYADNYGNVYVQAYYGTPRASASAGYTTDLTAFLTGTSISWSPGEGVVTYNFGGNPSSVAAGFGTHVRFAAHQYQWCARLASRPNTTAARARTQRTGR